ncbi:MAG TPA: hypothetical protein VK211_29300 [Kamptonema sp.]|nr:hypothetical protein [Kamptonema sp.]
MLIFAYLIIALVVFCIWFKKFWGDATTPKDDRISWIALAIGPLFWPIVLPLSILELTRKKSRVQIAQEDRESEEILEEDERAIADRNPTTT